MGRYLKGVILFLIVSIIIILPLNSYGVNYDQNSLYVTDGAGVLSAETKNHIININKKLEKTGAQVAVVTVRSLEGEDIRMAITDLFKRMELGSSKEDNGLLILFSLEDRQIQVEVGYGLEGALPDTLVVRLIDQAFIPFASEDEFDMGIRRLFDSYVNVIAQEYNLENIDEINPVEVSQGTSMIRVLMFLIILYIIFGNRGGPGPRSYRRRGPTVFIPGGMFGGSRGGYPPMGGGGRSGGGGGGRSF